ncbi:hypothetical protein KFK09_005795 [Dendrobium nobile]|uniref:Uncharacterized protein n=1 Tax=Dendrobium nobile TaxID=94219 RepID=A0A8T3BWP2_DENNO|nr:hypothetical protein KFK09_005795 [Dendrobium nobile]
MGYEIPLSATSLSVPPFFDLSLLYRRDSGSNFLSGLDGYYLFLKLVLGNNCVNLMDLVSIFGITEIGFGEFF